MKTILILVSVLCIFTGELIAQDILWQKQNNIPYEIEQALANRIQTVRHCERTAVAPDSFQEWLRYLPLKQGNPPVLLFNGKEKSNQSAHAAVVNLSVGIKDLQQCADAVMRLRAEYLYSANDFSSIHFNFTNGERIDFTKWAAGKYPSVKNNKVSWIGRSGNNDRYSSFINYLELIFTYAGSSSLSQELIEVNSVDDMNIGDVFIQGGFPGHAVIVVDRCSHPMSDKKYFLLAQSYMPAQEIHILKNLNDTEISPWYDLEFGETLHTPEWTFKRTDLKRFP